MLDFLQKWLRKLDFSVSVLFGRKLKIGIICHPAMGGSGIFAVSLAGKLAARGHEVHIITYKKPFRINSDKLHVHTIPFRRFAVFEHFPITLVVAAKIEEMMEKHDLDVVNVHYALPYVVSAYIAKQIAEYRGQRIPLVTTVHGTDIHTLGGRKEFKSVMEFSLANSEAVSAVARYLAGLMEKKFNLPDVEVIPNGVDPDSFDRKPDKKLRARYAAPSQKVVLHASNFRPVKRTPDLIRAFARARKKTDAVLVLIGDGPERRKCAVLAKKLGVGAHVHFVGKKKKTERYYSISDVFALSSEKEACPLSILEAYACGVPVVSTAAGGVPEIVEEGVTGHVVAVGDVGAFSRALVRVLLDPQKLSKMRRAARQLVLQKYTLAHATDAYEDLLYRVKRESL